MLLFVLVILLLNWPLLSIPFAMGLGAAYLYLFVLWAAVILVLFLAARRIGASGARNPGGDEP